jgi:hypothetical protein
MRKGEVKKGIRKRIKNTKIPKQIVGRDFPDTRWYDLRKAVCKRCHCVMVDCEPAICGGEFYHPSLDKDGKPHSCINTGKRFKDVDSEIEPFLRKRDRRRNKRNGVRP